ncbi:MAG TPA: ATP-binding protein [Candidatus Eisenbacteria bacterium]|nr:ATP-binding protein [Candidatus Eisenbacteria bacterium]
MRNLPRLGRALLCALLLPLAAPAHARQRVMRVFDEKDGLMVSEVQELAQDARGFLWIGTSGGVVRFDGREMRPWAPDVLRHVVDVLATAPDGEVLVGGLDEPLELVSAGGVTPWLGPDGRPIADWVFATLGGDGTRWLARPDTLLAQDRAGRWRGWGHASFDSSAFYRVRPGVRPGEVFVATRSALWRLAPPAAPEKIADVAYAHLVAPLPDGSLAILTRPGRLYWLKDRTLTLLLAAGAHGRGLAVRGHHVWASLDQYVVTLVPGATPDTVAPRPGVPTGRPMLVDREGSLWIGGYNGLMQYPEPGTVAWNAEDGLPSPTHAYAVTVHEGSAWIGTWYGGGHVARTAMGERAYDDGPHSGGYFTDGFGRMWTAWMDSGFIMRRGGHAWRWRQPGLHTIERAARRPDGTLWLATSDGLFVTPHGDGPPARVTCAPPSGWNHWHAWLNAVLEDSRGTLWVARGEELCHAPAADVARGGQVAWTSETLRGSDGVAAVIEMPSGTLWAATGNAGVQRRVAGRWQELPGARAIGSLRTYNLVRSPSGGVWIAAAGGITRVAEAPESPAGLTVLERLTAWQGVPNAQASDVVEEPDGRVWLAGLSGAVEVPPEARRAAKLPPRVELVETLADGRPIRPGESIALPWRRNRLELRFAALSYRDRTLLRYRLRLSPRAPWIETREPVFQFVDLSPGRYDGEILASLDGVHWSASAARVRFRVRRPLFLEPAALAGFVLLAAGALLAAHRVRVAFLLRLERQRTRIAMDLHDEMGSGLGSIGILAGLASDPTVDDPSRRRLAGQIAAAADELGSSLADIVGSLRAEGDSLDRFAAALAERAARLFPEESPRLVLAMPERLPAVRLPLEVRRNLQRIAVEALHNVARHARARVVELGLAPDGEGWRLWVADDGRGLTDRAGNGARPGGGHGLGNMRARAAQIGARLEIATAPGGGTRVEVRFHAARLA